MSKRNRTMDAEQNLKDAFSRIGKDFGYDTVEAKFVAFNEFKLRWQRTYTWASFKVSDFLKDAPIDVLEDTATMMFTNISGEECGYSDKFKAWVLSDEFIERNRATYIRRHRNLSKSAEGEVWNLDSVYARLVKEGKLEEDPNIRFVWMDSKASAKATQTSVLMKTITFHIALDSTNMPEFVIEFLLYTACKNMELGRANLGEAYSSHSAGDDFPRAGEANEILKEWSLAN